MIFAHISSWAYFRVKTGQQILFVFFYFYYNFSIKSRKQKYKLIDAFNFFSFLVFFVNLFWNCLFRSDWLYLKFIYILFFSFKKQVENLLGLITFPCAKFPKATFNFKNDILLFFINLKLVNKIYFFADFLYLILKQIWTEPWKLITNFIYWKIFKHFLVHKNLLFFRQMYFHIQCWHSELPTSR
jgi:hypothetical protein